MLDPSCPNAHSDALCLRQVVVEHVYGSADTTNNFAKYGDLYTVSDKRRPAATLLCLSVGILRKFIRKCELDTSRLKCMCILEPIALAA